MAGETASAPSPASGRRGASPLERTGRGFLAVGVALAVAGVVLGVDRVVDLPVDVGGLIAGWWPLVLVVIGGQRLARRRPGGVVVTVLALALLSVTAGGLSWLLDALPEQELLAPLVLIVAGVAVLIAGLAGGRRRRRPTGASATDRHGATRGAVAVFSDAEVVVDEGRLADSEPLEATAVFGDATVVVPAGVAVTLHETVLFGEIEVPAAPPEPTGRLAVQATAVFGEVTIERR